MEKCPVKRSVGPYAHWLMRLSLAGVFLYHGYGKTQDLAGFAEMTQLPIWVAGLVTFAELAGGLGLLVGGVWKDWVTRLAGLALVPVMLGAIFMVHWGQWSFLPSETHPMGGIEFQVVLLTVALYFAIVGNGLCCPTSGESSKKDTCCKK